jgi:hypothetical protein
MAVPHLKVQACQATDTECTAPLPDASYSEIDVVQPGVPLPIPTYIIVFPYTPMVTWFLRLSTPQPEDPTKYPDYLPFEYYFGGPLIKPDGDPLPNGIPAIHGEKIPMLSAVAADRFADSLGRTRDKSAGIIALRTIDCLGRLAKGVTLTLEPNVAVPFSYLNSTALSASPPLPTDQTGIFGFANIPLPLPGTSSLTPGVQVTGNNPIGARIDKIGTRIRPGYLTGGEVRPFSNLFGR